MASRQTDPPAVGSDGPAPDARLSLAGRLLVTALGATAAVLGGVGVAYASTADDSHWVTVVEEDPPRECPDGRPNGGDL